MTWDEFKVPIADPRFILPIWDFTCDLNYVPIEVGIDTVRAATNIIGDAVIDAIRGVEGCPLSAIHVRPGRQVARDQDNDDMSVEPAFVTIANTSPVYDFAIQLGPKTLRIFKVKSSLADLIATVPILHRVCEQLFTVATNAATGDTAAQPNLLQLLDIQNRLHRFQFSFEHRLRLGTHIAEGNREALNVELIEKFVRGAAAADRRGEHPERIAPILSLGPEGFYRGDVSVSMDKSFGDKLRNIWVIFEGPFNITQKDVNLRFDYRCGEGRGQLELEDLTDWRTPIVSFYRDMIVRRLLPSLFYDIRVEARLS